jgi:hypothetical protein
MNGAMNGERHMHTHSGTNTSSTNDNASAANALDETARLITSRGALLGGSAMAACVGAIEFWYFAFQQVHRPAKIASHTKTFAHPQKNPKAVTGRQARA